jgi:hypothetical protein
MTGNPHRRQGRFDLMGFPPTMLRGAKVVAVPGL